MLTPSPIAVLKYLKIPAHLVWFAMAENVENLFGREAVRIEKRREEGRKGILEKGNIFPVKGAHQLRARRLQKGGPQNEISSPVNLVTGGALNIFTSSGPFPPTLES